MATPERRYTQIYTGHGKGKTTAAIGQAVRAAGSRLKSLIIMFMKDFPYGEVRSLGNLGEWITVERYGNDAFVFRKEPPSEQDIATAHRALARAREAMLSGSFDIIILDEVCVCTYFQLLTADDVIRLLDEKPDRVELILTGRYCPPEWIERADLVTEMTEVKHYYRQGVLARKGFES
jgi:cob(I)alamin adenosyltransferase